jgi:hypothetical protein
MDDNVPRCCMAMRSMVRSTVCTTVHASCYAVQYAVAAFTACTALYHAADWCALKSDGHRTCCFLMSLAPHIVSDCQSNRVPLESSFDKESGTAFRT